MKHWARTGLALATIAAAAAGCGSGGGSSAPTSSSQGSSQPVQTEASAPASSESFDATNWDVLATDPDSHRGASVDFVGKVFTAPQRDSDGVYLQVWEDAQNSENNTIIGYRDSSFQVSEGDYVHVTGTVKGTYKGKNAFGAELAVPAVIADKIKVVPATAAAPPAINTYGSATYTQAGITVTIQKVEFAASETRVFVKVKNASAYSASVYDSSMKAVQAGRQYDATFSMNDYPELSSDLVAGASTSGVIVFPKMNPNGNLKLVLEVNSDNSNVGDYGTLGYTFTYG